MRIDATRQPVAEHNRVNQHSCGNEKTIFQKLIFEMFNNLFHNPIHIQSNPIQ